jgi:hypothetical protein
MARSKNNGTPSADVLAMLPAARRREIVEEARSAQVRAIVDRYQRRTIGALVDALQNDPSWSILRDVSLVTVMGGGGSAGRTATRGRRRTLQAGTLDRVAQYVHKHPGLRSEQIQAGMGGDHSVTKAALAKLRELKRVKTSGERRATTYTAN